jgi:hypothetical protein
MRPLNVKEVVTHDRQGHRSAEGMTVPGRGIKEKLPVTCAGVTEHALLY